MFRAQANQFDEAVAKATDENLTSENWALILDVCDRVSASPQGPANAVAALIKRLSHRNANVQLYTLELANALSQNCGPPIHRELSSRSFTDALIRLAGDRNVHQQVKSKVLERMEGWTEMFGKDPDLGIMEGAYERLKRTNPTLVAPSKPVKREIEDTDRKKEDEELQMALALSLKEAPKGEEKKVGTDAARQDADGVGQRAAEAQRAQQGTTAATVSRVRALYDFSPSEAGELAFRKGDVIAVLESVYKDWWKGSLRGNTGIFPLNYVEKLQDPTKEEMEKDAMMEGEVFAQIRNVEKLLALLSVRSEGGMGAKDAGTEEEIQELYNQTLAIRPKLIELIGKYSQKKDDFTQLNEKFIKARRDYEALLESSMSQPPAGYGYPGARVPSGPYQHGYPPQGAYPPQQATPAQYPQQRPQPQQAQPSYSQPPQQQQQYYQPPPSTAPADPYTHTNGSSSAFHFLPSGAPPPQPQSQHAPPPSETPKPLSTGVPQVDSPYSPQPTFSNRPQSIHTLNSGNPQELATTGYESPVDNRHSYPSAQSFPPQQQAQQTPAPYDVKPYAALPSQQPNFNARPQKQASFESAAPSAPGAYPPEGQAQGYAPQHQQQQQYQHQAQQQGQQGHSYPPPPQPEFAPPQPPQQQQGQYRAYSPNVQGSVAPPPQQGQQQGQAQYPGQPVMGQPLQQVPQQVAQGGEEDYYR
ncbi:Class E vacuolar protein-sorting machinery protein hse1 [Elsinoe australis]|uniref:Class E vacuolar protein-sorting machinery protein HSE1 n=1 Tax=Elsinoe australis TaxID=40998 RepID=A0A2P7ZYU6_9PEZI|nr:Class E vacuolar protein-sorting machinery protein hse1 [Elsinoe australis]